MKQVFLDFRISNTVMAFGELEVGDGFVFEQHKNMVEPHIQIKVTDDRAGLLRDYLVKPFSSFNGTYAVEPHAKVLRLL